MTLFKFLLLVIALLFSAGNIFWAQKSRFKYEKSGWMYLSLTASPDYCYRVRKSNANLNWYTNDAKYEKAALGYHASLTAIYKTKRLFSFEMGIRYSVMGYNTASRPYYFTSDSVTFRSTYTSNYLDFPLGVCFSTGQNRLQFTGGLFLFPSLHISGATINYISYPGQTEFRDPAEVGSYMNLRIFGFWSVTAGCRYELTKRWSVLLRPEFKMAFHSTTYAAKLWSAGINLGIYYSLTKSTQ